MDKLSSTEFRRVYATLEQPVEVTVNGHAIGTWLPSPYSAVEFRTGEHLTSTRAINPDMSAHDFNTRPFTPAPKKEK